MYKQIYKCLLVLTLTNILVNCGNKLSINNKINNYNSMKISSNQLTISNSTLFPISNNSDAEYYLKFTNNSNQKLTLIPPQLDKIKSINSSLTVNKILNTSYCREVNANQSCYIIVNPPSKPGSIILDLNYQDQYKNTYKISTLVNYGELTTQNGFKINSDLITIITNKISNNVAIAFKLKKNFNKINLLTNIPTYSREIKCTNNSYLAGTYCTAFINAKSGDLVGKITITGSINEKDSIITIPLQITQVIAANLITNSNAINIKSPNTSQLVLYNNGNSTATNINVINSTESKLNIINGCTGSLNAESSCIMTLSYTGNFNGNATINIGYQGGKDVISTVPINVVYYAESVSPGLTMYISNNLIGTQTNTSRSTILLLKNTSTNSTVINLETASTLPNNFVFDNTGIIGVLCSNKQFLIKNESCQYGIKYNAPSIAENGTLNYFVKGNFINQESLGTPISITSYIPIPYSALTNGAILNISPSNVVFSIRNNNIAKQTQIYTVINNGDGTALNMSSPSLPSYFTLESTSTCKSSLAVNESCNYIITFGPLSTNIANTNASLNINYYKYSNSITTSQATSNFSYNASNYSLIRVSAFNIVSSPIGLSGLGTSGSPYIFTPVVGNTLILSNTYTNIGNATITNFNIATNTLPIGYYIESSSTCPYNSTISSLSANSSCILKIGVVESIFLIDELYLPIIAGSISPLGYSYLDSNSILNILPADSSQTVYINTTKWGQLSSSTSVDSTNKTITLTVSFIGINNLVATGLLTATADISNLSGISGSNTCNRNNMVTGSCFITLNYDSELPSGTYYFPVYLSTDGGGASTLRLKTIASFTL